MRDPLWADLRPGQRKINPEIRERLELYIVHKYTNEGKSLRDIAELTGRSFSDVHHVLQRRNVTMRPRGVESTRPKPAPMQMAMFSAEELADLDRILGVFTTPKAELKPEPEPKFDEPEVIAPVSASARRQQLSADILRHRNITNR